jgi:signal transduction histidine kinase
VIISDSFRTILLDPRTMLAALEGGDPGTGARVSPLFTAARLWDHEHVPLSVAFPHEGAARSLAAYRLVRSRRVVAATLAAGSVALAVEAYRVQVQASSPHARALVGAAAYSAFVAAGLVAWLRRPANMLGPLMLAAGLALLARQLRYSQDAFLFTVFFLLGDLGFALVGHSVLAYPAGRVEGRGPRLLVRAGYATALVFPLAVLIVHGASSALVEEPVPRRSLLEVADRPQLAEVLQKTEILLFFGVFATLLIAVILRRLVGATPRARRMLAPLLLAAVALALRAVYENVQTFADRQPLAYSYLFWWQIVAFIALPLALLAGMLRARLARAQVSRLVLDLDRTAATPTSVRDALARALADPTLELFFWLPERRTFVDVAGAASLLPEESARRAVTRLEHDGEPVAAIAYDPSLLEDPVLIEAAGAAAGLALENARLHAETRAQLQQVRESRRRLVSVADEERRRIERNLHDGAQQRLLALALALRTAQLRAGGRSDDEVEQLLGASVDELQATIAELRALARGLHPTVLTEYGLAAALAALADRSAIPVTVDMCEERLAPTVEATAYFVACETLNNVAKHAHAETASIVVRREGGLLLLEVADDGVGGARAAAGSGLQGMADRVEALGGVLRVESPAAGGTRVVAEIPCAQ